MTPGQGSAGGNSRKVSVVIVNYRTSEPLADCIASLANEPVNRIIVVDNFSTSEERVRIRSLASLDSRVTVIELDRNVGFGAGINVGFMAAGLRAQDVAWMLNPDTTVLSGAVDALLRVLVSGEADFLEPLILTGDPSHPTIWFAGGRIDRRRWRTVHLGYGDDAPSEPPILMNSDFLTGTAIMTTGAAWNKLGGFREDFFLYWEDADLSIRVQELGLKMVTVGDAVVWHSVGGASGGSGSAVYYHYMQRNRVLVASRSGSLLALLRPSALEETARLLLRPLRDPRDKGHKFLSSVAGLIAGFREIARERRERTVSRRASNNYRPSSWPERGLD